MTMSVFEKSTPQTPQSHASSPRAQSDSDGFYSFSYTPSDHERRGTLVSPGRLRRKAASSNLVVMKSPQHVPVEPHNTFDDSTRTHEEFLTHPRFHRPTNLHSIGVDLLPYYSTTKSGGSGSFSGSRQDFHASNDGPPRLKRVLAPPSLRALIEEERAKATPHRRTTSAGSPTPVRRPIASPVSSDVSTPSLSRFPLPPRNQDTSQQQGQKSEAKSESATPTVYHFRGASFEFVNPRKSLCIQRIETPAEAEDDGDGEHRDYFPVVPDLAMVDDTGNPLTPNMPQPYHQDVDQSTARSTPPRSLFDDLPSAYNSITSRSGHRTLLHSPQLKDLPLPPTPIPTSSSSVKEDRPAAQKYFQALSNHQDHQNQPNTPVTDSGPPSASFRKRLSLLMRGNKEQQVEGGQEIKHAPQTPPSSHESPSARSPETPWTVENLLPHTDQGTPNDNLANSPGDDDGGSYHYYDSSSIFGHGSDHLVSEFNFPEVFSTQPMGSSHTTNGSMSRDDSTGDIIASYGDRYANFSPAASLYQRRRQSMPLLAGLVPREGAQTATNSTIGQLLDQYGEGFVTQNGITDENIMHHKHAVGPEAQYLTFPDLGQLSSIHARTQSLGQSGQDVRFATARALRAPPSAPPASGLPVTPEPTRLQHPTIGRARHAARESVTPSAGSYGTTRNLLLMSDTSIEIGRGAPANRLSVEPSPSDYNRHSSSRRNSATLSVPNFSRHVSLRSVDAIIDQDLRYLSGVSGDSEFAGSIFIVGDTNGPHLQEDEEEQRRSVQFVFADGAKQPPTTIVGPENTISRRASIVPIAAFSRAAVEPAISRMVPVEQAPFDHYHQDYTVSDSHSSISSGVSALGSHDDHHSEWETVADSRPTFDFYRPDPSMDSDNRSSSVSSNTLAMVGLRSRDMVHQHNYDFHSPTGPHAPIMPPSNVYYAGQSFPNPNALTPSTPALYNSYRHPSPISPYSDNPFTSSPPQITDVTPDHPRPQLRSSWETSEPDHSTHPIYQLRGPNLSVIQEQTEQGLTSDMLLSRIVEHPIINCSSSSVVLSVTDSLRLGSEPGPAISLEADHGSPQDWQKQKNRHSILSSGADASLINRLRIDDPRMGSSPLSVTNSFNKYSYLGPKGNITGSPFGTGMQEAGSSVIGSSPAYGSSPPVADQTSPAMTPESVLRWNPEHSPLDPHSRLSRYDQQRFFSPLTSSSRDKPSTRSRDGLQSHHKPADAGLKHPKRSVSGQRRLMEMTLVDHNGHARGRDGTGSRATVTTRGTHQPLLPHSNSSPVTPRLRHRYRSPSSHASELCHRKRRISWICFAICALFPYLLILYGHNGLNAIMVFITNGEIQHFGHQQKKYAKIVGWSTAGATVLTLIVAFIIIRTLPNSYP